jgi:hypothetical protein
MKPETSVRFQPSVGRLVFASHVMLLMPGAAYAYVAGSPLDGNLIGWAFFFSFVYTYPLTFVLGLPLVLLMRKCPPPKLAWTMVAGSVFSVAFKFPYASDARYLPPIWHWMGVSAFSGGVLLAAFWLAVVPGSCWPADKAEA